MSADWVRPHRPHHVHKTVPPSWVLSSHRVAQVDVRRHRSLTRAAADAVEERERRRRRRHCGGLHEREVVPNEREVARAVEETRLHPGLLQVVYARDDLLRLWWERQVRSEISCVGREGQPRHDGVGVIEQSPGHGRFALVEAGSAPMGESQVDPVPTGEVEEMGTRAWSASCCAL